MIATLAAIIASLLSAAALYAASPHCRWPSWRQRGRRGNTIGAVLAVLALALWIAQLGVGAGLCAMLGTWMGGLMALPYLAWRTAPQSNGGSH
ncbi:MULTISPECIES: hypothetical protein [unclassified Lysobacter]|uniref:hypothetical protein n=1 Tax=unclassified Lysobacter TaxID=2635362 RepID=UPI001C249948|nr:hypothetical protein [Lysobacter sp. MMG2]MBU8977211.1 hypothetical protein [Lysobacter sp. MMG2]